MEIIDHVVLDSGIGRTSDSQRFMECDIDIIFIREKRLSLDSNVLSLENPPYRERQGCRLP
jgi:hypothetical protein